MSDELPKRTRQARGKVQVTSGKPNHFKKFPSDMNERIQAASERISAKNGENLEKNRSYFRFKRETVSDDGFCKNEKKSAESPQ